MIFLEVVAIGLIGVGLLWLWNRRPAEIETHSRIYNEWWKKGQ